MEDYKEKYEMALEGIQEILSSGQDSIKMPQLQLRLQGIFPELKESEDERVKKRILLSLEKDLMATKNSGCSTKDLEDCITWLEKQGNPQDKGEISDGYHTFNELYYYRMLYNAAFFNMLPKEWVYKSKRHNDGEECFGGGWFIVMANLPTGQISNHYELKDWDLFQIPEKEVADKWDGHTPQEAADRLHKYLLEKQGTPAKLSEEKQNSFAKGVLSNCALSFINYLDAHSYEGKMCVSNGECEDIENAFHNAMWDRLHRYYCKYIEKQGEQKPAVTDFNAKDWYVSKVDGKIHDMTYNPADKVEPKFKIGDYIVSDYCAGKVVALTDDAYLLDTEQGIPFSCEHNVHLWTIQDAKDGDVLIDKNYMGESPFIFKETKPSNIKTDVPNPLTVLGYCGIGGAGFTKSSGWGDTANCIYYPATKEQRDLLFTKMKEAGYEWNAEKKELKKIEENSFESDRVEKAMRKAGYEWSEETHQLKKIKNEEYNGEDYGIDSLFHAQRILEKTLGSVDGYQSDDGILEHKCAISAVKKLYKTPAWSEEDDYDMQCMIAKVTSDIQKGNVGRNNELIDWLKSLKDRATWKPSKEQMETLEYYMHTLLATEHKEVLFGLYNDLKKL